MASHEFSSDLNLGDGFLGKSDMFSELHEIIHHERPHSVSECLSDDDEESLAMFNICRTSTSKNFIFSADTPVVPLRRSLSCPLTMQSEENRNSSAFPDFFRSVSRNSGRDTNSTLPLSPARHPRRITRSISTTAILPDSESDDDERSIPNSLVPPEPFQFKPFMPKAKMIIRPSPNMRFAAGILATVKAASPPKRRSPANKLEEEADRKLRPNPSPTAFVGATARRHKGRNQKQKEEKQSTPRAKQEIVGNTKAQLKLLAPKALRAPKAVRPFASKASAHRHRAPTSIKPHPSFASPPRSRRRGTASFLSPSKPKSTKGLKYLSNKICETLSVMRKTTQEEMIATLFRSFKADGGGYEESEKSIRRRIYDTLNVLLALGLVTRAKQEIEWTGCFSEDIALAEGELPTKNNDNNGDFTNKMSCFQPPGQNNKEAVTSANVKETPKRLQEKRLQSDFKSRETSLRDQIAQIHQRVAEKRKLYDEDALQFARTKTLLDRNRNSKRRKAENEIHLPFLVVQSPRTTNVMWEATKDQHSVQLHFTEDFEIHNDFDVLRMMSKA